MKLTTKLKSYIDAAKLTEFSLLNSLSLTSENSLRVTLSRLVASGDIYNPTRGVYVSKTADPFWVACSIYPGYISLSTAFYLNNLTEEYPFTIFVASNVRRFVNLGNHTIVYFKAKDYLGIERKEYNVASIEKAICDSLHYPKLVNYTTLTKVLYYAEIKYGKFFRLCPGKNSAFFQRLGYLLSILPKLGKEKKRLLGLCKRKVKANVYLQSRNRGVYIKEWKLIDNIGRGVLLSWWQQ